MAYGEISEITEQTRHTSLILILLFQGMLCNHTNKTAQESPQFGNSLSKCTIKKKKKTQPIKKCLPWKYCASRLSVRTGNSGLIT